MITWEPSLWPGWSDWRLAKERSSWRQDERSTFVHCRPSAGRVSRASENRLPWTGQHTLFGVRMFKTITRAKAIRAKAKRFKNRTRVQSLRECALHRGATNSDNVFLFFLKINSKQILREKAQECGEAAPHNSRQSLLLAMKVAAVASGWLPSEWWDRMPVHMSHTVTIIVLLINFALQLHDALWQGGCLPAEHYLKKQYHTRRLATPSWSPPESKQNSKGQNIGINNHMPY